MVDLAKLVPLATAAKKFGGTIVDAMGRKIGVLPDKNQAFKDTFNKPTYYHGTFSNIEEFDPNMVDLGVHVGTTEQANERLKDLIGKSYNDIPYDGAQILPLKVKVKNPLAMHDVGMWNDSEQVFYHLYERASGKDIWGNPSKRGFEPDKKLQKALEEKIDFEELDSIFESFGDRDAWQDSMENREFLDEMKDVLKEVGYDGIEYKNIVESTTGGMGELLPDAKSKIDVINAELKEISNAVFNRRDVSIPDVNDPDAGAKIQEWLSIDSESLKTPREISREYELVELRDQLDTQRTSPNSLIVFDPENIRSVNAAFNPEKSRSSNLLYSAPASGMLGYGALGQVGEEGG